MKMPNSLEKDFIDNNKVIGDIEEKLDSCLTKHLIINHLDNNPNWSAVDLSNGEVFKLDNVCIVGLPGIGKTSRINSWAENNKHNINFVSFDASLLRLYKDTANNTYVFTPETIELMSKPNTVVFFDNYQCVSDDVKKELNNLFDYRKVNDESQNGKPLELNNILFTIVAITEY